MRRAPSVLALGALLWLVAPSVQGLGFGRSGTATVLGQPLNFSAIVRLEADESLSRECVSADVESGEVHLAPAQVRVTLEPGSSANERVLRVTTTALIDEPVVAVNVSLGCLSRVSRRFVAFIDPPVINLPGSGLASNDLPMPAQHFDSAVAPILAAAQGAGGTARVAPAPERAAPRAAVARKRAAAAAPSVRGVVRGTAEPVDAVAAAKPRKAPRVVARATPARAPAPAARLQLDPATGLTPPAPVASAPGDATAEAERMALAQAVATAASQAQQASADHARLQALEADLQRLAAQDQAAKQELATARAQVKVAEAARFANPVVYGLAWLAALLAAALVWLLWRRSRASGAPPWWAAPNPSTAAARTRPATPRSGDDALDLALNPALEDMPALVGATPRPAAGDPGAAVSALKDHPTIVLDDDPPSSSPPTVFPSTAQHAPEPSRELSVDELIDLEQQADFFVALGQDDEAVDLLMNHVRSSGGASPLPYLKLLEIYRRRGEAEPYERIRERFNRRFNAYAPDWSADLQQGNGLDDHLQLLERIQSLWGQPHRVMGMLDAAMLRRDGAARPFDLPACREMLMLYSVARDLSEHGSTGGVVDVFLPLDAADAGSSMIMLPLDLDVSQGTSNASSFVGLVNVRARPDTPTGT